MYSKIILKNTICVAAFLRNTTAGLSACNVNSVVAFSKWYVSHTTFALLLEYVVTSSSKKGREKK